MNIDTAVNLLRDWLCVPNSEFLKPKYQAIVLGIEALKRIQELRTPSSGNPHLPLPGETKE